MPVSELREHLSDLLNRVAYADERIVIERRGKSVAALVSPRVIELLEAIEDVMDIQDATKALKERGGASLEEVKAQLGL